jgi:hypothetical protein
MDFYLNNISIFLVQSASHNLGILRTLATLTTAA